MYKYTIKTKCGEKEIVEDFQFQTLDELYQFLDARKAQEKNERAAELEQRLQNALKVAKATQQPPPKESNATLSAQQALSKTTETLCEMLGVPYRVFLGDPYKELVLNGDFLSEANQWVEEAIKARKQQKATQQGPPKESNVPLPKPGEPWAEIPETAVAEASLAASNWAEETAEQRRHQEALRRKEYVQGLPPGTLRNYTLSFPVPDGTRLIDKDGVKYSKVGQGETPPPDDANFKEAMQEQRILEAAARNAQATPKEYTVPAGFHNPNWFPLPHVHKDFLHLAQPTFRQSMQCDLSNPKNDTLSLEIVYPGKTYVCRFPITIKVAELETFLETFTKAIHNHFLEAKELFYSHLHVKYDIYDYEVPIAAVFHLYVELASIVAERKRAKTSEAQLSGLVSEFRYLLKDKLDKRDEAIKEQLNRIRADVIETKWQAERIAKQLTPNANPSTH